MSAGEVVAAAHELYERGAWTESARHFQDLVDRGDAAIEGHYGLGMIALTSRDLVAAQEHFLNVLDLDVWHPNALYWLGHLAEEQGDQIAARTLYGHAVMINPRHVGALEGLTRLAQAGAPLHAEPVSEAQLTVAELLHAYHAFDRHMRGGATRVGLTFGGPPHGPACSLNVAIEHHAAETQGRSADRATRRPLAWGTAVNLGWTGGPEDTWVLSLRDAEQRLTIDVCLPQSVFGDIDREIGERDEVAVLQGEWRDGALEAHRVENVTRGWVLP